jgi:creatinine amidohydrolase/Fe(II)-dependent formamide hydrolase-like protein
MLYTHPDMVDMSKAASNPAQSNPKYMSSFQILNPFLADRNAISTKLTPEENRAHLQPSGVYGDASRATAEKGKRIFEAIVANTVEVVERAKGMEVKLKPVDPPV